MISPRTAAVPARAPPGCCWRDTEAEFHGEHANSPQLGMAEAGAAASGPGSSVFG